MVVTIRVSDELAERLERVARRLERIVGRRPSYEEVIELLLYRLEAAAAPDDVWF